MAAETAVRVGRLSGRPDRRLAADLGARLVRWAEGRLGVDSVFAPDATVTVPGRSHVAGDFVGRTAIDGLLERMRVGSGHTLRVSVDAASGDPDAVLVLRMTAHGSGGDLDDRSVFRARIVDGLVATAALTPDDQIAFDQFWGGPWRPLLTPYDRDVLASAWKAGTARGSSRMAWVLALVVAVVGGWLSIRVYEHFTSTHPPVTAHVSNQAVTTLQHATLKASPGAGDVTWTLGSTYAQKLTVEGSDQGTAVVVLPLDPSACPALAGALQGTCGNQVVSVLTPVTISWASVQALSGLGPVPAASVDLEVAGSATAAQLSVAAQTNAQPAACFSSPQAPTTLTVSHGGHGTTYRMTGDEPAVPCDAGLRLVIGAPSQSGRPPAFDLTGITASTLSAQAPSVAAQGLTGQIVLTPGGTTLLSGPSSVSMEADAGNPFVAHLTVGGGRDSLDFASRRATSVTTDAGELLPSQWDESSAILAPLLGALVAAAVVTPLGVVVQGLMGELDLLGHRLGGRLHRRPGGGGEPHA